MSTIPIMTDAQCADLHKMLFPDDAPASTPKPSNGRLTVTDHELVERMLASEHGDKIRQLWNGDWQAAGYPSRSEADQALANHLVWWCGGDTGRADTLFRQSGLMREKWDRDDYRTRTLENAAAACTDGGYDPTPRDDGHAFVWDSIIGAATTAAGTTDTAKSDEPTVAAPECQAIALTRANVRVMLHEPPPPLDYIFDGVIERKHCYSLQGKPGIGKSNFILQLGVSYAIGEAAFPSIRPTRAGKVLLLLTEDVEHHVWRRLRENPLAFNQPDLLENNLLLYCRQSGDFAQLVNGAVAKGPLWRALAREIEHEGVDLVIMDPLNRVYGLDENDNRQAGKFVKLVEEFAETMNCAIIVSHHVAKSRADSLEAEAGRGASALIGGWRAVISMAEVPKTELRYYCIPEPDLRRYVLVDVPKNNYGPRPSRPLAFARGVCGVLSEVTLGDRRGAVVADFLAQQFSTRGLSVNHRKLRRGMRSDPGVDLLLTDLKNEFGRSLTNKHIVAALDECLASGSLVLKTEDRGEQFVCAPGGDLAQHG